MGKKNIATEFSHITSNTYLKQEYNFCRAGLFSGSFR